MIDRSKDKRTTLTPEMEYQRLNPGAGGSASQQQERGKPNPNLTREEGGAGIAGSQNEDVKGRSKKGEPPRPT